MDLTKNPAFKKIPQYYKDTFPGLFDQSRVNKYQQPTADKLRKLPFNIRQGSEDSIQINESMNSKRGNSNRVATPKNKKNSLRAYSTSKKSP